MRMNVRKFNDVCVLHRVLVTMLPHLSSPRNPAARRGHHSIAERARELALQIHERADDIPGFERSVAPADIDLG